ncbi:TIGR02186 family protein [Azospirillum halopraeferens]|uniref:TIGR02186 family protein n=1 Tax=Azospirillum halopraeferens TaxID=34010 RepID=UPI00040C3677|nr:TIGR02186 family protein [Azospirillum halopraeferens]
MRTLVVAALAALLLVPVPAGAVRSEVVADLSDHLIAITTGFTGSSLLLFGATDGAGDVVLVVTGPRSDVTLRRKDRRMGIWVNTEGLRFRDVPSFYAVLSSRPAGDILDPAEAAAHGIGFDAIRPAPADPAAPAAEVAAYREALFRLKQEQGLYFEETGIRFTGERLFRADLRFPSSVPVGEFRAMIYLVKDGRVVSSQPTPLVVSKVGMGAQVHWFANRHAAAYGALAVAVSVLAGWLAGIVFRKKV